jgi:hypothetical protein
MNAVLELPTRTLCDSSPKSVTDGAYLYCQTPDNQRSVFDAAQLLLNRSCTARVWFLHADAKSGYPGFAPWRSQLLERGIPEAQIEGVRIEDTPTLNTLIESEALIRFARRQGYGSLHVVAPPFHQLKAFMTAVTVALKEYPELLIYSSPGVALSWQAEVAHSQGRLRAKRRELIGVELERIERYQQKGDIASFGQVLVYLNARDTAV